MMEDRAWVAHWYILLLAIARSEWNVNCESQPTRAAGTKNILIRQRMQSAGPDSSSKDSATAASKI